jgi:hypothetical protein
MSKPLLTRISCIALVGIVGVILFITITSQAKIGVQVTLSALWGYVMGDAHSWAVSYAVASTCSAAISANCHAHDKTVDCALLRVR